MALFNYSDWAAFGLGSSVTWEEDSVSRRRLTDLPESLTAEQMETIVGMLPPEQREMISKREMSFRIHFERRATLVERGPDRLVLEIRTTKPGKQQGFTQQEILPAEPLPPEPDIQEIRHWESEDGGGSATVMKQSWDDLFRGVPATEGDETLEIAGLPMACRWTERATDTPMGRFQVKFWRCADIPGGIARSTVRMEGPMEQGTADTTVVAFERKAP